MEITNKEIVLILSGNEYLNKQVLAHSQSLKTPVNIQRQLETRVTQTLYSLIINNTDMEPKHLLDRSHPKYQEHLKGSDISQDDWAMVLKSCPELLRAPVAIRGERVVICDNPSRIQSLDGPGKFQPEEEEEGLE